MECAAIVDVDSLDQPSSDPAELFGLLSAEERARTSAFRFDYLQRRYANGRGLLRKLLSARIGEAADRLIFTVGEYGKPALKDYPALHFNVSHSGSVFACAISECAPLGVDVEGVRPMDDMEAMSRRFFSPRESSRLMSLPLEHRELSFFECWTRKEAFLKATGEGLSRSLDSFSVSFGPAAQPAILEILDSPGGESAWQMLSFVPQPGFIGALAIKQAGAIMIMTRGASAAAP